MSNFPTFPHRYTENDTRPPITGTLAGVDITGYTITMHIERPGTTVLVKAATAVDAPNGTFTFGNFAAGDLVAGLKQLTEVQIKDASNEPLTSEKFYLDVEKEIA